MKKGRRGKIRTFYMSDDVFGELSEVARKTGRSKSKIVERGTKGILQKLKEIEDQIW